MDTHKLFKEYLGGWPDAWIIWPEKGKAGIENFFLPDEDRLSTHYVFDDLLSYIKEESLQEKRVLGFSCSEWLQKYFKTVRGREVAREHMARYEPSLAITAFNVEPLKTLMDGFILYVINKEVLPCLA